MKARNMLFNIDGLGVAWYTSSNADFERGKTVCQPTPSTAAIIKLSQAPRESRATEFERKAFDQLCTKPFNPL